MNSHPARRLGPNSCGVVEVREYALHRGARETLIELFERELVETQETVGIRVLGTFCDVDDPDKFVWLRGFADMSARQEALQAFYGGPVWAAHRDAANATMIDSDNVLLLRPLDEESRLALDPSRRPPYGAAPKRGAVSITVCPLEPMHGDAFGAHFEQVVTPALRKAGAWVRAVFVTERSENNYPQLPVREGELVFVWLSHFDSGAARDEHLARIDLGALAAGHVHGEVEILRLKPTARSLLPDSGSQQLVGA